MAYTPKTPLQQFNEKWAKLGSAAAGFSPQAMETVKAQDAQKVTLGGSGMSSQEALTAMAAVSSGQQSVPMKSPGTSVTQIPGNFVKDIGSMIEGGTIGVAHLLGHPLRDIKGAAKAVPATLHDILHPATGGIGGELKSIASSPIGKFVPGVTTAANLTTAQGRKQILQHPGFTAADLLPIAHEVLPGIAGLAGYSATAEDLAHMGKIGKGLYEATQSGETGKVATAGSAAEAALKSQSFRAMTRAASEGLAKLTHGALNPTGALHDVLDKYGIGQDASKAMQEVNSALKGHAALSDPEKLGQIADDVKLMHDPQHPSFDSRLSRDPAKQAFFDATIRNPTNETFARLDPAEQQIFRNAVRKSGLQMVLGNLGSMGVTKSLMDVAYEAQTLPAALRDQFLKHWTPVTYDQLDKAGIMNEAEFVKLSGSDRAHPALSGMMVPANVHEALFGKNSIFERAGQDLAHQHMGKIMGGFRTAIFLRPGTIANVAVGALVRTALESGGELLTHPQEILEAMRRVHEGDPLVNPGGLRNLSASEQLGLGAGTTATHNWLAGSTVGRMLNKLPEASNKVMNYVAQVSRSMQLVANYSQLARDYGEEGAQEMALRAVNQAQDAAGNLSPVERGLVKTVLPFYGHQKLMVNFVQRFAADHPMVTSFYSKLAGMETLDNGSGLPQSLQAMLAIPGTKDSKGNQLSFNLAGFNPFKNVGNMFTVAGLASQLNPLIKGLGASVGMGPNGHPELYPTMTVDPRTGALVAANPKPDLLGSIIPPLQSIEGMLGFNNRLKDLKKSDPLAYKTLLFSQAGIPLVANNPELSIAKYQENVYKVASSAASNFVKTGDETQISGYPLLPYAGRWFTPQQLKAFRNTYSAQASAKGVNIKDVVALPSVAPQAPPNG